MLRSCASSAGDAWRLVWPVGGSASGRPLPACVPGVHPPGLRSGACRGVSVPGGHYPLTLCGCGYFQVRRSENAGPRGAGFPRVKRDPKFCRAAAARGCGSGARRSPGRRPRAGIGAKNRPKTRGTGARSRRASLKFCLSFNTFETRAYIFIKTKRARKFPGTRGKRAGVSRQRGAYDHFRGVTKMFASGGQCAACARAPGA